MGVEFEAYTETVADRLEGYGFSRREDAPSDYEAVAFHRRGLWLRKPGLVDTVCVVAAFEDPPIPAVETFGERSFAFAREVGSQWPLGIGRAVAAIPVAACRSPADRLKGGITEYRPGHLGAFEFPVVVDLGAGTVHYNTGTRTWRRRTYAGFRKLAADALDPDDADLSDLGE